MPILETLGSFATNLWNQQANKKAQTVAYNRNIKLWEMNNLYNAPEQQMARLKEAGLNPNLVYGKGATALSQGSPSPAKAPVVNHENPLANTLGAYQNFKTWQSSLLNIDADTKQKITNTAGNEIRNSIAEIDKTLAKMEESWRFTRPGEYEAMKGTKARPYPSNFKMLMDARAELLKRQVALTAENATYQSKMNQFFNASKYVGFGATAVNALIAGAKLRSVPRK